MSAGRDPRPDRARGIFAGGVCVLPDGPR